MGRRLILDTVTLIRLERGSIDAAQFDEDDVWTATICVAEFRVGAELADTVERRAKRLAALRDLRAAIDVLAYTEATAIEHARLLAHARRAGRPRGPHDLIIAAHAAETGGIVVSRDAKARFSDLPGVDAIAPE